MNLIAKLLMNSLYGKFGMKVEKTLVEIFNLNLDSDRLALRKLLDSAGPSIQDHIELDDNKYLFVRNTLSNLFENEEQYHGADVNIAIASTITAAARVHMSQFKNNPNFNLYYSDTDSIVIDQPLSNKFIGKELGQLKLEHTISKGVFIAPKVYGLVDINGDETIKVKGLTNVNSKLNVSDLEYLLIEDSAKVFNQQKWYKSLIKGEITISDVVYNLKVTSNKRRAIYIDGVFTNTKPYYYDELIK
jgi:hypothetical protein